MWIIYGIFKLFGLDIYVILFRCIKFVIEFWVVVFYFICFYLLIFFVVCNVLYILFFFFNRKCFKGGDGLVYFRICICDFGVRVRWCF